MDKPEAYGYYPLVIGGWAVFSYVPTLGSRDIDMVFPARESVHRVLLPYYKVMGYKSTGLLTKQFYKEIKTSKGLERIHLDVCSLADKNLLHENSDIEVPWQLGMKYSTEWNLEDDVARVPCIEVLLIYKVKALADRRYDLKKGAVDLSMIQRAYFDSKIWKDEQDVRVLWDCKVDSGTLNKLLEMTGFGNYFFREIDRLNLKHV